MDQDHINQEKQLMVDQIKKYSPVFGSFFNLDISLKDYSQNIYKFSPNPVYVERQTMLKEEILKKFKKLFGPNCQQELKINFPDQLTNNIVDHQQILNHPLLIADNIIANVDKILAKDKQDAIVVISSGDVPPNNYFSKNGFQLHGKKVPIFSNSEKDASSYYLPKRDFDFINKLKIAKIWKQFDKSEQEFLTKTRDCIQSLNFSNCENYRDQITVLVKYFWPDLFEADIRANLPELLYVTQEELTTNCLLKVLDEDNIVTRALFDKQFRTKVLDSFRGTVVTWDEQTGKGTHFFWRKHPAENKLLRMYASGDELIPVDDEFKHLRVILDKLEIRQLLESGEICPSLFIIFALLNFYFGVKPLLGQGSIMHLNLLRDTWLKVLSDSDFASEIKNIQSIGMDHMIAGLALFFKRTENGVRSQYAFDIIYDGGIKMNDLERIFNLKFCDLLAVSAPGIYDYVAQKYIPDQEKIKPAITTDMLGEVLLG